MIDAGKTMTRTNSVLALICCCIGTAAYAQQAEEEPSAIERLHGRLSERVLKTADTLDSFFGDDSNNTWQDNETRVRLRLNVDQIQDHGTDVGAQIKLNLILPALKGRLRLVANDDDNSDSQTGQDSRDDSSVALRYIGFEGAQYSVSFDLGLRIKDSDLDPYVRANTYRGYGLGKNWAGRTEGRVYYYDKTGDVETAVVETLRYAGRAMTFPTISSTA